MATPTFAEVLSLARLLSTEEQHELVEALSEPQNNNSSNDPTFPPSIQRGVPVQDIRSLIAPFWSPDESADDIIDFIRQQRDEDRYL